VNYFNQNNVDNSLPTQNILSYCSGIRGIETGLERSGLPIKTVAFLEIEAFIVANLVAQMEVGLLAPAPIWTNIKTFDARPFRDRIHGIVGGYPCQPFSHAGQRKGIDDERHLFPHILEQVKTIRPEWVFFENVAGHLSMGYEEVRRSLSDIGYRVEEGIFTAQEVGAPHRRERLFILGIMQDAGIVGWGRRRFANHRQFQRQIQTSRPGTSLDNTYRECEHGCVATSGRRIAKPSVSSEELANTHCDDTGTGFTNIQHQERTGAGEAYQWERMRGEPWPLNSEMANTCSTRNEIGISGQGEWQERLTGEFNNRCDKHQFPAGQGTYQHPWEEPRTIESGMVYTIDGYNFTEDLHRAIGNSVVEQTAELAFISLIKKQIT